MNKEKTVTRIKKYTIEIIVYSDKSITMKRINDGFDAIELLGLCNLTSLDIQRQMNGVIEPTKISRVFITDKIDDND